MSGVYHAPYPDTYRFNGSADACAEASLSFIRDQILVHLIVARRSRGDRRRADPGRGRLHRAAAGVPAGAARADDSSTACMLVLDEVQSGMGRTGKMFASEHFGVKADIVNIAKGIASGLPLGDHLRARGGHELAARARTPARSAAIPVVVRRRAGDDPAAARAVRAERRDRRRAPDRTACASCRRSTRSSATCAAGA